MLGVVCYIARGIYGENTKVLGSATEKQITPKYAYRFAFLELPEWTSVDQAEMEEIQRESNILVDPSRTEWKEMEYPDLGTN